MWNAAASQDRKDMKLICESVNRKRMQWCILSTDGCRPPSKCILTQCHCTGTNLILHLGFPVKFPSVSCLFSTRGKTNVLISFFMCFYLSSAYWDLCAKLAAMCYPRAFQCCGSGICCTWGVTEIQASEFPWHSFHVVHEHMLKIHCVGHVQAPPLPFPLLKVLLAHQVIFSPWLESCWSLLRGAGSSLVFSVGETYILLLGHFLFPSLSERAPGMQCLSELFLAHVSLRTAST